MSGWWIWSGIWLVAVVWLLWPRRKPTQQRGTITGVNPLSAADRRLYHATARFPLRNKLGRKDDA